MEDRAIVAKALGLQTIPASVRSTVLSLAYAKGWRNIANLVYRKAMGLWLGKLIIQKEYSTLRVPVVRGKIEDYEGVWSFARNVERARQVYSAVGADGKALQNI